MGFISCLKNLYILAFLPWKINMCVLPFRSIKAFETFLLNLWYSWKISKKLLIEFEQENKVSGIIFSASLPIHEA